MSPNAEADVVRDEMTEKQQQTRLTWLWAAPIVACLLRGTVAAGGSTYKWVDEQGAIHYSDRIPNEALTKGGTVLDKQGRPVQKIDALMTPEQRNAKAAEEERQRTLRRAQEERARRDRALMQSYTTEADIDFARGRALSTIGTQLKSAESYGEELLGRQQELAKRKLAYGAKPVPASLEQELSNIEQEVSRQNQLVAQKKEEMASAGARYDADKQRWQQIRAEQEKAGAAAQATASASGTRNAAASTSTAK